MKKNLLTRLIFGGMLFGVLIGALVHHLVTDEQGKVDTVALHQYTDQITLLSAIFLRLIKLIILPLVFTTLVVGVAKLGDVRAVGRIGGKALLWFFSASLLSLSLGMLLVNVLKPGVGLPLPADALHQGYSHPAALTLKDFIGHIIPEYFFKSIANYEVLPVLVIAILFGVAASSIGEKAGPLIHLLDSMAHVILKMVGYIMWLAPLAVFASLSAIVAQQGLTVLKTYGILIGEFYGGLLLLWLFLVLFGFLAVRRRIFTLLRHLREAVFLAFGTASSESAYPRLMMELERFGIKDRIVSFVLPLGYSFNLDGSMMYMTFGTLFLAQSYGVHLSFGEQLSMLLILMVSSKGVAGVPRAAIVVIAGVISQFHIPEAGLVFLLGIDQVFDMGRAATNVLGNAVATVVVNRWEEKSPEALHKP